VEQFAAGENISLADAEFVLGAGGKALADFAADFEADQRFGAVWVAYNPFSVHLRTTQPAPELSSRLAKGLGREAQVTVGGLSRSDFRRQETRIAQVLELAGRKASRALRAESDPDSRSGTLGIRVNALDRPLLQDETFPVGVDIRTGDVELHQPSSYAGAGMSNCTVGFAATQTIGAPVNQVFRGVVTAGHCANSGQTAYGYALGTAQQEICSNSDRQLHTTSAPNLWYGFFDFNNVWTTIQAVAGGWYSGQPFVRKGRIGSAFGVVGDPKIIPVGGNGDCGTYQAYTFPLFNTAGTEVIGGDSGGPLMLIYNGLYYLAGITTAAGSPNNGIPTNGWAAWRDVPSGWVACTAQNRCN
jgi:hypothetical protein